MRLVPRLGVAGAAILAIGASPSPARTPSVLKLAGSPPSYNERYSRMTLGSAPVAPVMLARVVVGIHRGHGAGQLDMDAIRIGLPANTAATAYCIRIATADGRYTALNSYTRTAETAAGFSAIETKSTHRYELARQYTAAQVVIRATASPQCTENTGGPLIPALPPGSQGTGPLVVFLNLPGDVVQASLNYNDARPEVQGRCSSDVTGAVAYSHSCEIDHDPTARAVRLTVKAVPSGASRTLDVLVEP